MLKIHEKATRKLHLHAGCIRVSTNLDRDRKLSLEDGQRAQLARKDVVEERPELCQPVLDRRAAQNDAVHRLQLLRHQRDLQHAVPMSTKHAQTQGMPGRTNTTTYTNQVVLRSARAL